MPHEDFAPGTVWLVGAGPGDPDLLTRKALRLLLEADMVFHDALIGPAILALIPDDTPRISVGKRSGRHSRDQASINDLLVSAARAGRRVLRLKGGDPSIFGRSAEEVAYLAAHGVPTRICPGITAASAAAAGAGVSLTLRGHARNLMFLTARTQADGLANPDWDALAKEDATLAIYMGRAVAGDLARGLIAAGRSPDTPVLIAVNVSLPDERLIRGRLSALAFLVRTIGEDDPTLLLVGEAVGHAPTAGHLSLRRPCEGRGPCLSQQRMPSKIARDMDPCLRRDDDKLAIPEPQRSAPPADARPRSWKASPSVRYRRPI